MDDMQQLRFNLYGDAIMLWPDKDPVDIAERAYRFIINGSGDKVEHRAISPPPLPSLFGPRGWSDPDDEPVKTKQHEDEPQPLEPESPAVETCAEPEVSTNAKPVKLSKKLIDTWLFIHRAQQDGPVKMAPVIEYFGIARTPAQRRLQKLRHCGYIKSIGAGRAFNYITVKTPPGVVVDESPIPQPPEPVIEPESSVSEEAQISVAREAARWMQSIGYPIEGINYGQKWRCKGITNPLWPSELVAWANTKRAEKNLPPFELGD